MSKFVSLVLGLGVLLMGCAHLPPRPTACTPPEETAPTDDGPAQLVQCQWPGGHAAMCVYGIRTKQGPDIRTCGYLYVRENCAAQWVLAKVICKGESALDETL
jgi:hypothetical protein